MRREESQLVGAKGTKLFIREWKPEEQIVKAVVCLVHGMGEYGERYHHVAEYMTNAGIAVIALDQHGHGRSSGKLGHMHSIGEAASDAALIIEEAGKRHPGLPIFLYGHSMGGNVALNCALRLHPAIQGLIITSPWLRLAFKPLPLQEWLGRRLASIVPNLHQSTRLNPNDLFRPGYAKASPIATDPLCHTKITVQAFNEIVNAGEWVLANIKSLDTPLLLLHGTADRVTSYEASRFIAEQLGKRCDWRSWNEGFHELHNDVDGELVIYEIIEWIDSQL